LEGFVVKRRSFLGHALLTPAVFALARLRAAGSSSDALLAGPMLGYGEIAETVVWLQTRRPARAQVRYWKQGEPGKSHLTDEVRTAAASDHIARFVLSGLDFGARYDYEIYLDGERIERPYPMTFKTQPMWRWRTDPPNFKVAFGSCNYVNDSPFDRPGTPYGDSPEVFAAITTFQPDLMLWLGDNCYYREADWLTEAGMRYRYAHTRSQEALQPLLAATHHYAIWDDHDYGPNDSDRTYRGKETSLRIFKDYWANPSYGTPETPGVFGRFEWGDVEFFMLDDRYHRSPNAMSEKKADKVMFGDAQMQWLMESLRASEAPFKIVVGGNQMLNPLNTFEGFNQFPFEQKKLIDFIRNERVSGVLFLSGDRHYSELLRRNEPGMYPLYDFTSSSLTAGFAKPAPVEVENPSRVPGTLVVEKHNFGVLEFSGPKTERVLTLRCLDGGGLEQWRKEIKASELTFPKPAAGAK
jgi:alkaline phosphatase D